jgi:hypothetical protein
METDQYLDMARHHCRRVHLDPVCCYSGQWYLHVDLESLLLVWGSLKQFYQAKRHESLSTFTMLKERNEDLIKHPVTETFIHLKWQQIRWLFYLSLFLHILSATITTITILKSFTVAPDNVKNSHQNTIVYLLWAMAAAHVPVFVMLILEIFQKRSSFFTSFWWSFQTQLFRKNRKIICFPLPSLKAFQTREHAPQP